MRVTGTSYQFVSFKLHQQTIFLSNGIHPLPERQYFHTIYPNTLQEYRESYGATSMRHTHACYPSCRISFWQKAYYTTKNYLFVTNKTPSKQYISTYFYCKYKINSNHYSVNSNIHCYIKLQTYSNNMDLSPIFIQKRIPQRTFTKAHVYPKRSAYTEKGICQIPAQYDRNSHPICVLRFYFYVTFCYILYKRRITV